MEHRVSDGRWLLSFFCVQGCRHRLVTKAAMTPHEARKAWGKLSGGPCPKAEKERKQREAEQARLAQEAAAKVERSFPEVVAEYLDWSRRYRPRSHASRLSQLHRWEACLGSLPLSAITVQQVETYLHRGQDAGWKPSSRNRARQALFHLFRWAIERGYASQNPVQAVETLPEENEEPRALTPDEERRLLGVVPGKYHPIFLLALHTGLRVAELKFQEWRHVDLVEGTLQVTRPKHVRPQAKPPIQIIPLNDTAKAILGGLGRRGPRVFPDFPSWFSKMFGQWCRQAGLPPGVAFHKATRDTFSTRLAATTPTPLWMLLTRHRSYQVARRYLAQDLEAMRDAVNRLVEKPSSDATLRGALVAQAEAMLSQVVKTQDKECVPLSMDTHWCQGFKRIDPTLNVVGCGPNSDELTSCAPRKASGKTARDQVCSAWKPAGKSRGRRVAISATCRR